MLSAAAHAVLVATLLLAQMEPHARSHFVAQHRALHLFSVNVRGFIPLNFISYILHISFFTYFCAIFVFKKHAFSIFFSVI